MGTIEEARNQADALSREIKAAPPDKKADLEEKREGELDRIEQIADKKPDSVRIQKKAAETFMKVNAPARAILRADRWVTLAPADHDAVAFRSRTFYSLGDYHSAEKDARKALQLDPNDRKAFALLKLTEGRDGPANKPPPPQDRNPTKEQAEAVSYLDMAGAEKAARDRKAVHILQESKRKIALGDFVEAARIAEKAAALSPKDPQAHLLLAKAKLETGDAKGAEAAAFQVIFLDPRNAAGHLILAQAEEALGMPKEEVLALYEEAVAIEPRLGSFYQQALARYAAASKPPAGADARAAASEGTKAPAPKKVEERNFYDFPLLGPVEEKTAALLALAISAVFFTIGFIYLRRPKRR